MHWLWFIAGMLMACVISAFWIAWMIDDAPELREEDEIPDHMRDEETERYNRPPRRAKTLWGK
jgi:hypothetical protein